MATVDVTEAQLAELMDQLETETGVSATVASAPAVVVEDDDLSALAALEEPVTATSSASVFSEEELAEADRLMAETALKTTATKPKADLSNLQSELASLTSGDDSADDDLSALAALENPDELPFVVGTLAIAPGEVISSGVDVASIAKEASKVTAPESTEILKGTITSATITSATITSDKMTPVEAPKSAGLKFFVDPAQFKEETQIKGYDLDTCFMQQSSLRAYYGTLAASAEAQASRNKTKFEVLEARLYDHHRKILTDSGAKVTEKAVENAVKTDPRWLAGKETVIDADTIAAVNKALAISLADRRDMLIQLGADRRDESKGQARLMAAKAEQENMAMRASSAANALKNN